MRRWAKTYMTYSSYHTGFRTTKGTFHFRTSHVHWCHGRYPEERQEPDGWRHHLHFTETLKKLHGEGKCVILQSVLQYPLSLINLESVSIYTYIISYILFHTFQIYCTYDVITRQYAEENHLGMLICTDSTCGPSNMALIMDKLQLVEALWIQIDVGMIK